jgi:hypothetical protein
MWMWMWMWLWRARQQRFIHFRIQRLFLRFDRNAIAIRSRGRMRTNSHQ